MRSSVQFLVSEVWILRLRPAAQNIGVARLTNAAKFPFCPLKKGTVCWYPWEILFSQRDSEISAAQSHGTARVPRRDDIKKILLIGSGPIIIGQACEFDYSGTQACKALREEGYEVVLVNSLSLIHI